MKSQPNRTEHAPEPTARRSETEAALELQKLRAIEERLAESNTLYRELQNREAKVRRLVDANIVGVLIWDLDGRILEANDAFLRMVGYQREDLLSGRLRWKDLTPPEWLERDERLWVPQLKITGSLQPFEKEFFRKDRSRVPVLIGGALFEAGGSEGVAFVLDLTERKQAEEGLRRTEKELRDLVENMPAMAGVLLPDGSHPYLTNQWREYSGLSVAETDSEGWRRVVHPEDIDLYAQKFSAAAAARKPFDHELRLRRAADGEYRWFLVRISPLCDGRGNIVKWHGVMTDIQDRKRAEQELRDVFETMPTMVWIAGADGGNEFGNRQWLEYTGLSDEKTVGSGWQDAVYPTDLKQHWEKWCASRASGEPFENEVRYRRAADGQYRWFISRAVPVRDGKGEIVRWYGVSTDIEDRKRAEEALRRSETYLTDAQRLTHTGSWAWRVEATDAAPLSVLGSSITSRNSLTDAAVYLSDELYRIYGFDPKEGVPSWEERVRRVHPEDRNNWREAIEKATREKSDCEMEFRILLPDGTVKWIHSVSHPVLTATGELVEFVGSSSDVTGRKLAEQAIERSRKLEAELAHMNRVSMMGELTASIAHEINQPLTVVVSNANACARMLSTASPDLDEVRLAVGDIADYGRRASEVLARIRGQLKKSASAKSPLNIGDVIVEVLPLLRGELEKRRTKLDTHLKSTLPLVLGDRIELQQVLINLLMNGIESMSSIMDRPRVLTVQSRVVESGEVEVAVRDCGVGISVNEMRSLFDPFFTTKPGGMGMGLPISRSIIEAHGGKLWASSNANCGATFQFTLPAA